MKRAKQKKLHAAALLGAVTGLSLVTAGGVSAQPPRWPCEDALPGQSSHDRSRCAYEVFPFSPPEIDLTLPGPSPAPPYTP